MPSVLYEIKDSVAIITLNRPEKYNSFNREMALSLQHILDECANDNIVRAVYITGNGKSFCAGQDLAELTGENPPDFKIILSEHFNPVVTKIRNYFTNLIAFLKDVENNNFVADKK